MLVSCINSRGFCFREADAGPVIRISRVNDLHQQPPNFLYHAHILPSRRNTENELDALHDKVWDRGFKVGHHMPIDALNVVLEPLLGFCQAWAPISHILRC